VVGGCGGEGEVWSGGSGDVEGVIGVGSGEEVDYEEGVGGEVFLRIRRPQEVGEYGGVEGTEDSLGYSSREKNKRSVVIVEATRNLREKGLKISLDGEPETVLRKQGGRGYPRRV